MKKKFTLIAKIIIVITSIMFWIYMFFPQLPYWLYYNSQSLISNTFHAIVPKKAYEKLGVSIGCPEIDGRIKGVVYDGILTRDGELYKLGTYSDGTKCKKVETNIDIRIKEYINGGTYSYILSTDDIYYFGEFSGNNVLNLEKKYDFHREDMSIKYYSIDVDITNSSHLYAMYEDGLYVRYFKEYSGNDTYVLKSTEYKIEDFKDAVCNFIGECFYLKNNGELYLLGYGYNNNISVSKVLDKIQYIVPGYSDNHNFVSISNEIYHASSFTNGTGISTPIKVIDLLIPKGIKWMSTNGGIIESNKNPFIVYTEDGKLYQYKSTNQSECSKYSDIECTYEYIDVTKKYIIINSKPTSLAYNHIVDDNYSGFSSDPSIVVFENGEAYVIYQ